MTKDQEPDAAAGERSILPKPAGDAPDAVSKSDALSPSQSRGKAARGTLTRIACVKCRLCKAKCDGADPCARCKERGFDDCFYPHRTAGRLQEKIKQLNEENTHLKTRLDSYGEITHNHEEPHSASSKQYDHGASWTPDDSTAFFPDQHSPVDHVFALEASDWSRDVTQSSSPVQRRHNGSFDATDEAFRPQYIFNQTHSSTWHPAPAHTFSNTSGMSSEVPNSPQRQYRVKGQSPIDGFIESYEPNSGSVGSSDSSSRGTEYCREDAVRTVERLRKASSELLQISSLYNSVTSFGNPNDLQSNRFLNLNLPEWRIPTLTIPDNSVYSELIVSFRDGSQRLLQQGVSIQEVLGPDHINVDALQPNGSPGLHNASTFGSALALHAEGLDLFVQLGCAVLMTHLMRWMIMLTPETYARIPHMIRPLPCQRFIPHSPAIDLAALPSFREALVHQPRDFLTPISRSQANASVHWPYGLQEAIEWDAVTGCYKTTKRFEDHVTQLSNWSLNRKILETFPEVASLGARIREGY